MGAVGGIVALLMIADKGESVGEAQLLAWQHDR
jgi:hypothetical protein